jgi:hypothetical protein
VHGEHGASIKQPAGQPADAVVMGWTLSAAPRSAACVWPALTNAADPAWVGH